MNMTIWLTLIHDALYVLFILAGCRASLVFIRGGPRDGASGSGSFGILPCPSPPTFWSSWWSDHRDLPVFDIIDALTGGAQMGPKIATPTNRLSAHFELSGRIDHHPSYC